MRDDGVSRKKKLLVSEQAASLNHIPKQRPLQTVSVNQNGPTGLSTASPAHVTPRNALGGVSVWRSVGAALSGGHVRELFAHRCSKWDVTDAGSLSTFRTQPQKTKKNHAAITVTSWLSEPRADPRPALGAPKRSDDSLTLNLCRDRKKAVCTRVCAFIDGLNEKKMRGERLFSGD